MTDAFNDQGRSREVPSFSKDHKEVGEGRQASNGSTITEGHTLPTGRDNQDGGAFTPLMRAWEVMVGNRMFNMLDAIMFAYMYRGKVSCMEQLHSTGMREIYHRVRKEIVTLHPKLKVSGCALADYCTRANKSAQRELLRRLSV